MMASRGALAVCLWAALVLGTSSRMRSGAHALRAPAAAAACCRLRGGSSPANDYTKMKLSDLQKELRARELSTKGLKNELIQRLETHLSGADGDAPGQAASAKRDAPEPTDDGGDDNQAREKQAAVADEQRDMGDGEVDAAPVPVPVAVPARVHVDPSDGGFVKVYNSYAIKDKCRAAGFQWDATEKAWTRPSSAVLEQLGEASFEQVTPEAVLEMIEKFEGTDAAATTMPAKEPEACRAEVQDGMVKVSGGTYGIKDKLRAAGFRWDGESYCWTRSEPEVTSWINELRATQSLASVAAGSQEYVDAVLATVTDLDEAAQGKTAVDPVKSLLVVKEDKVFVYNSYDIKDKLRALGFRFSSAERAWSRPLEDVLTLSSQFQTADDVTLDQLLELNSPELPQDEGPPMPSLKVVDTEVEVYNSYSVKDQLRALGFRWNGEKAAWTHNVDSVMEAVGVDSADQITIAMCVDCGEKAVETGTIPPGAVKQTPELRIEGEDANVYKSYDVKDKLRAIGFNWNADSACWRMDAMQLLESMPGFDLGNVKIEDVLAINGDATQNKDPARLEIADGEAVVYNSYEIKDKLRALGFRWDGSRSVWTQQVAELMERAQVEDESHLQLDKILELDMPAAQSDGEAKKPYLTCDEDEVSVFNSYDIKDKLRALNFRWEAGKAAWCCATSEVLSLLSVGDNAEITMDRLLECSPPEQGATDENGNLVGAAGASLEMMNDEVLIYNSYAIKDKLRNLEFRFDSERRAWVRGVWDVKTLLALEDHADITLDKILAHCESMPQPDGNDEQNEGAADADDADQGQYDTANMPGLRTGAAGSPCRSPSPAQLDQTPGHIPPLAQ